MNDEQTVPSSDSSVELSWNEKRQKLIDAGFVDAVSIKHGDKFLEESWRTLVKFFGSEQNVLAKLDEEKIKVQLEKEKETKKKERDAVQKQQLLLESQEHEKQTLEERQKRIDERAQIRATKKKKKT
jgi:hypothetical protein